MDFDMVSKENLYEIIADQIEQKILAGEIAIGEKLPSETALSKLFGVSRNVIREALRTIKERGLINVRVGSGVYVCRPPVSLIGRNLARTVTVDNLRLDELFEMRLLLEGRASRMAAQTITKEQLLALEETLQTMRDYPDDSQRFGEAEVNFHCDIAKASRNEFLYIFISSLNDAQMTYTLSDLHGVYCKEIVVAHDQVYQALRNHDERGAEMRMSSHIVQAYDWIRSQQHHQTENDRGNPT